MTLQEQIEQGWETRGTLTPQSTGPLADAVRAVLQHLDTGQMRVAEKQGSRWVVHDWLKKALLLSFPLQENRLLTFPSAGYDKIPSKFEHWSEKDFQEAHLRVVPGAHVRYASYLGPHCVLMPSFINFGVFVGKGTMIDIGAQIGSCAQIGARCHVSASSVIGGVVEPLQARPVIVEDNCFIGAQCALVEGIHVEEGAVLGMGTHIGASTPLFDRQTGEVSYGRVPPYAVVVPGMMPSQNSEVLLPCGVIVKHVDAQTRSKTEINDLLRL